MANTDRRYFEQMYASDPDPWQLEESWYEQRKYALTVAALPKRRYRSAFEPGCSIGVLTSLLAPHCDQLLATEIVRTAFEQACLRLKGLPHVRCERRAVPEEWPSGTFDLVVLSEIAYYFDAPSLEKILALATSCMPPGATLVGVHWRGPTNYPLSGDAAHDILHASRQLRRIVHHVEPEVVMDLWERIL